VDRLACVNVPALPLQLLLRIHPEWSALPAAVVEGDRPQALVLCVNAAAHRAGVRSGQRYATALAFARDLRASPIPSSQIEQAVGMLADRLRTFSPHVEPASDTPGVFWLDAHGLDRLYPSLHAWAKAIRVDLHNVGFRATVAVGFSRFGVYALATSHRATMVCADAAEERALVQRVPLSRIDLAPDARDRLFALGITTVGGFVRLPGNGIRTRFGPAAGALHQLAAGVRWAPLVPLVAKQPHERSVDFDEPETHAERLVFIIKRLLDTLVAALAPQAEAVVEIALQMTLDDRTTQIQRVRPAAPTLDTAQLLTLVRLRLDTLRLAAGIVTLRVIAASCPAAPDQYRLFMEHGRRDLTAANETLARLRAECGEENVMRARIRDAHLPAAQFAWERLERIPVRSAPRVVAVRPLVRRIYETPVALGANSQLPNPKAQSPKPEAVSREPRVVWGPYVISGGWWAGGVRRDYYFVHADSGDLWWLYYDQRRQRFFLQGRVE
jgi:protein ImuB